MNETPDILLFFGRFHPLLVHLPIGFLVLLVALESLARFRRFRSANASAGYILALLVPSAVLSAGCGWLLSLSGDYRSELLQVHRWLGFATAGLCTLTAGFRWRNWTRTYTASLYLSAIVLAVTSHFGGSLTHGSDYLTRYAPAPIQALLGRQSAKADPGIARPQERFFSVVIEPILQARCAACHNPEKRKGGLRLDTWETLQRGGKNGPVIVAGKAAESPLVQRLLLPLDNDDHMPPEGKPQPTPEEIAVLSWWIDAGAPPDAALAGLRPPAGIRQALESLGIQSK